MGEATYYRFQRRYCSEIQEYLPEAFRNREKPCNRAYVAAIMEAILGNTPVSGKSELHMENLVEFTASFKRKTTRPFLQTKDPWHKATIKKRGPQNHYYGRYSLPTKFDAFYGKCIS